jgi:hypothetical protein
MVNTANDIDVLIVGAGPVGRSWRMNALAEGSNIGSSKRVPRSQSIRRHWRFFLGHWRSSIWRGLLLPSLKMPIVSLL